MILAIEGGGDWFDASVSYWVKVREFDVEKRHRVWLDRMRNRGQTGEEYFSFEDYLLKLGFIREAIEGEDIEVIRDC